MRRGIIIIGVVVLAIAVILLFIGNDRLTALTACSSFSICSASMNPGSPSFQLSIAVAKIETAYGTIAGFIGVVVVVSGLLEKGEDKHKSPSLNPNPDPQQQIEKASR